MKYIRQSVCILAFTMAGELLQELLPLPIPAAIYGMVLLLIALFTGLLKPAHIKETADFLIGIMPLFFVAPAVKLLEFWGIIAPKLVPVCIISAVSTLLVFIVAGLVTQALLKRKGEKK